MNLVTKKKEKIKNILKAWTNKNISKEYLNLNLEVQKMKYLSFVVKQNTKQMLNGIIIGKKKSTITLEKYYNRSIITFYTKS